MVKIGPIHITTDRKLKAAIETARHEQRTIDIKILKEREQFNNKIIENILHDNAKLKAKLGIV